MDNSSVLQSCLLSNFQNLISVRLDNSNYVTWKFLVETMLAGCALIRYIDGSFSCPPQNMVIEEGGVKPDMTKDYKDWVQNDAAVMSILAATLSSDALSFIVGSKTSREIWCRLKERYVDDSRYNIMNLKNSLYNIKKGSDSIDRYLFRVKSICDQLATMGVYMDDEDIVVSVLNGLPSEFATIKTVIRMKALSSSVSMKDLRSLLLIGEDEIEQTLKSISLSLETAMAAIGDTSRGNVQSHSLNSTCLPSSEMEFAGVISNSNVPQHIVLPNNMNHFASAFTMNPTYAVNAMMQNGNFGVPLMSNNGHMATSTPSLSAGLIVGNIGSIAYPLGSSVVPTSEALCNGTISQPNTSYVLQNGEPLQQCNDSPQQPCDPSHKMSSTNNGNILQSGAHPSTQVGQRTGYFSSIVNACKGFDRRGRTRVCYQNSGWNNYRIHNSTHVGASDTSSGLRNKKFGSLNGTDFSNGISNTPEACQICNSKCHTAQACSQRFAPRQVVASGSYMQCQICMKSGHSAAECLHRHTYSSQQPTHILDASQTHPLHIGTASPVLSKWQQEVLKEIEALPVLGNWRLLSTSLLCQSLPLINPG